MKELGITKGETFALRNQPVQRNGFYIETNSAYIGEIGGGYLTLDQYRAIGELLIDGANTAQKCGLLPSELLRQRDELLIAMIDIRNKLYLTEKNGNICFEIAETTIKNTEPKVEECSYWKTNGCCLPGCGTDSCEHHPLNR